MSRKLLTTEGILTLLAETPPRLSALTSAVAETQLHTSPNHAEWSANDVLAHLRACADVWGSCIMKILAEDAPTFRAINPTAWIKQTNYLELEFVASLHAFAMQRAELLAVLEGLPQESWVRTATVKGAGKALQRTVLTYADGLARHERAHIKQVERIINTIAK